VKGRISIPTRNDEEMNQQKTKYQIKKDINSFKERVNMKEETRTPKKLLSHKGAIVFLLR
jgi:hypothetical protein